MRSPLCLGLAELPGIFSKLFRLGETPTARFINRRSGFNLGLKERLGIYLEL